MSLPIPFRKMFSINNIEVGFWHCSDHSSYTEKENKKEKEVPATICIIRKADTKQILVQSEVKLYYKDRMDKNKARKYALSKALKELYPDSKLTRMAFWDMYFETRGKIN